MTQNSTTLTTLEELKSDFDQSFSKAVDVDKSTRIQALVFQLSCEQYAISLEYLQELLLIQHITKIPCAPPVILGVINRRGEIMSVTTINPLFGLSPIEVLSSSRMLVTKNLKFSTAILVDSVQGIISVKEEDIQPPLTSINITKSEFIQGEFYHNDKLTILLDLEKLSNSKQMIVE